VTAQRWRAYHAELPREAGARVRLDPAESHHVWRVLRRRPGDRLDVFDGVGHEWAGVIEGGGPRALVVELRSELTDAVEAPLAIVLFQAACRPERMDWVVQKATELGVDEVRPLGALAPRRGGGAGRLGRLQRIAVESAKQCGRRRLPRIDPVDELPEPPSTVLALLLDERKDAIPLGDLLAGPAPEAVWLAVGPESGFAQDEVARGCARGWRRAGLGPRTLRTETAGLVAAAIVLHHWGDVGRAG